MYAFYLHTYIFMLSLLIYLCISQDGRVEIATGLRAGRPRDRSLIPGEGKGLSPFPHRPYRVPAHSVSDIMGTCGYSYPGVTLTAHIYLMSMLRMCGVMPPLGVRDVMISNQSL
jgi:hypothetical protein